MNDVSPRRPRRRGGPSPLAAAPILGLLLIPVVAILVRASPAELARQIQEQAARQALALSLATSTATLALALLFGTPLARVLARRPAGGRRWLELAVDLPTVLPPAVAGLGLLFAFGRRGLLGGVLESAGLEIAFTPFAVVLAQSFVAVPYYVRTAAVGLAALDPELEVAAELDGATPAQVFRSISLPLAWRGFVGGAALCWARALGEFGATIVFAGNFPGRTQTMPLAVYLGLERDLQLALTLAVILIGISFVVLFVLRAVLREG